MDTINSPDDMMDFVANAAKRAVNKHFEANMKYIGENAVKELQSLVSLVTGKEVVNQAIGFEACDDDSNVIVPKNLYTLLLMNGVFTDYDKVKDMDDYVSECGVHYTFNPRSSFQYIRNGEPIEIIKCFITV